MFNKIGFRTWKSGKLWLYMGVLGSTIILGSSPVSAMDSVGNQSQGNVLELVNAMQKTEAKVMF